MVPTLFVCHGAPSLVIEDNEYTRFLKNLAKKLNKPEAIVIFTAHWESEVMKISSLKGPYETIYDFYGFPEELYSIKYPAKGSVQLSEQLQEMFQTKGIKTVKDTQRGLDHGSWVILQLMYPEADVPVVQISVNPTLSPKEQYKIGEAIADLRDQNVLIIGSGATVHNLGTLKWDMKASEEWAVQFDDWLIDKVENWDVKSIFSYRDLAPHARLAVPREEHFVPLLITMGSGDKSRKARLLYRGYDFGTLSYICMKFE
ncbi:dioxygenase [Microaerobacter geothermalis]|uniref:DODA-type extradiol aromatic ring-opening family dioxygenase n=1 Tax=Microaerobacter geothermalis TaxID=674972 RepID=UPI001F30EEAA|nr:class III extradiol ring-cleavage dioxygenase [Microaerobacter geothermalis]MCF6093775.1 dioxygenase [Microaerobacter geothermalis]